MHPLQKVAITGLLLGLIIGYFFGKYIFDHNSPKEATQERNDNDDV